MPDWVYSVFGPLLVLLAFMLLAASMVPILRPLALHVGNFSLPVLGLLVWFAFALSWISAIPVLQEIDKWWSEVLYWGGLAFLLILAIRPFFSENYRSKSDDDEPKVTEEPSLRAALFVGGFVLFLFILGRIPSGRLPEGGD